MFGMPAAIRVLVAVPPEVLREGYDGLSQLARDGVKGDPLSGDLFVFANRKRDRIKILYWDRDSYAIWMKRLEKGTYRWPSPTSDHFEWTASELAAVLGGIDLDATRKRPRLSWPQLEINGALRQNYFHASP